MPIYEYQCSLCEHRMEALQKISDAPLTECPVCHKPGLKKLVSAASFRLKGGGWYETDFKTEGRKQLAESDSGTKSESKSDNSASGGSDSKSGSASAGSERKQGDGKSSSGATGSGSKTKTDAGKSKPAADKPKQN